MAKIGVNLSIDVTKINKELLFKGQKGTYLDATVFIDIDQKDQYDNNGMITQKVDKDAPIKGNILGNCKVFWNDGGSTQAPQQQAHRNAHMAQLQQAPKKPPQQGQPPEGQPMGVSQQGMDQFDDDLPF